MAPKSLICPKCGQPNLLGSGVCWSCGTVILVVEIGVRKEDQEKFQKELDELRRKYHQEDKNG